MRSTSKNDSADKQCSICGNWFAAEEFNYRNKEGRSYCQKCDKEEMAARKLGGNRAAREYRECKRAEWK
jgi:hypothetical protein